MGSALDSASLIMYPSGYSDGVLGSAKPTDGSGDFTFTRGSNLSATRVGPNGYIEKGYENLLLQSNTFSDTTWIKSNTSITGGQAGYDGTNDAWLLEKAASSGVLIKYQTLNITHCFNVYAKAGTLNWIRIRIGTSGDNAYFNLDPNATGSRIGAFTDDSAQIEDIGNGWFRCSVSYSGVADRYRIYPADDAGDVSGTTGSVYIQDAMLNQGLVAYPYIETTTAPVAGGILEDEPRIDFSDGCGHLLLEPSRTNLIKYSEYFLNYPWTTNSSLTSNYGVSPEGVQNSTRVEFSGSSKYLVYPFGGNPVYGTIYVKGTNGETINFGAGNVAGGSLFTLNGDWQRIGFYNDGTAAYYSINTYNGATARDIEIYGAQLEQDATYPTSYIPTYGVSQTRLADRTDRGSIPTYTGDYTLFMEFQLTKDNMYLLNGNFSSGWSIFIFQDDISFLFNRNYAGGKQINFANKFNWAANLGENIKMSLVKRGVDVLMFVNGVKYTPSSGALATGNEIFDWRFLNYSISSSMHKTYIKQLVEFQIALSDSECIALTTI